MPLGRIHSHKWGTRMNEGPGPMQSEFYDPTTIKTKTELIDYLGSFVECAIHMILFTREVYPSTIFQRVRRFNVPVYMSDFKQLNEYIGTLIESMKPLFFQDLLKRINVVICTDENIALENFAICFESVDHRLSEILKSKREEIDTIDKRSLESILRSFLLKLSTSDSYFKPLPKDVTFYVMMMTSRDLNSNEQELLQGDPTQKIPWVLADIDQSTAFRDSSIIPFKSLESDVLKIELFAQEINKN